MPSPDLKHLKLQITEWAKELGFSQVGITDTKLDYDASHLKRWLKDDLHQPLRWMADHGDMRYTPEALLPGTTRVISVRLNYLPNEVDIVPALKNSERAYVSRYALGRDYHKLMRKRLAKLGKKIEAAFDDSLQRPLVDSAPALERALARKAGHGWVGKNTMLINEQDGSYFFLGELFTNIPLEIDKPDDHDRCGSCDACLKVCPTDAFVSPYVLETNRCISYLTIENTGPIPLEFREAIGNRVFGCDDCQAICPFNREPSYTEESDFQPRNNLDTETLLSLFEWPEEQFLERTEGSAIRRAGFEGWQRNLIVGLGNSDSNLNVQEALQHKLEQPISDMIREHLEWALERQLNPKRRKRKARRATSPNTK